MSREALSMQARVVSCEVHQLLVDNYYVLLYDLILICYAYRSAR